MKSQVDVYARIKPAERKPFYYETKDNRLTLSQTKGKGFQTKLKENLSFGFTEIFDTDITQEELFNQIAKPVILQYQCLLRTLEGFNGTIFAYGQSGSGKTFTMSGAETWQMRGIIPRALTFLFDELEKRNDLGYLNNLVCEVTISFMEIYNENAYDLLDKKHLELPLEQWNKVMVMQEDDINNIRFKNINVVNISNEQEGLDLLMMGNFIRQVSSTPLNQTSTRSHCVFTISLEGNYTNDDVGFTSKLHLVDLAGSERVYKTQVEGTILNEAKHINLSLSFLEQVIIALHEKSFGQRTHIPYRNSLLTTILKDSLGGNCKTVMIANLSSDGDNIEETISTARFAQRCAQLENEVKKNEKIDLKNMVKRLELENLNLIQYIQQSRELQGYYKLVGKLEDLNENQTQTIPQQKKKNVISQENEKKIKNYNDVGFIERIENYLNDKEPNLMDVEEATECFKAMKAIYNTRMKEYVTELTFISEKLKKYDEILTKKKRKKEKELNNIQMDDNNNSPQNKNQF